MVDPVTTLLRRLPLLIVAWGTLTTFARAHVLDEYLQATLVAIEPDGIRLRINLTPGVEIADKVIPLIDRDGDGVASADEAMLYIEMLHRDFIVRLDGREVDLSWKATNFPRTAELRSGHGIIQVECAVATGTLAIGAHKLVVENRHFPTLGVYLFNAARPNSASIQITRQNRNLNQSTGEIQFSYQQSSNPAGVTSIVAPIVVLFAAVLVIAIFAVARRCRAKPRQSKIDGF